ncbi:MAG: hypothetical protein Pars2KO_21480 [Parasphingorhabdus sp.]
MIFVQGWIKVSEKDLPTIIPAASTMMIETVKEEGCLHYSFAHDIVETGLVQISERWDTEESLNAHFQTSHMLAFNKAISELSIEAMDIRMYSGDETKVMMQS